MDLDLILPKSMLRVDDPDYQFEKKEAHMEFLYRNNLKNNYIMNNVMEQSFQYFKDILELMLMLDYDIFRISLIMYRNFDFTDYKESYVKITKILYKNQYQQIKDLNNLDRDILSIKKTYNSNQLWDEINIQTSPVWIMEFASFLRLDGQETIPQASDGAHPDHKINPKLPALETGKVPQLHWRAGEAVRALSHLYDERPRREPL